MRRPRALRSRLFSWFFGAILLAILTSSLVVDATRTDSTNSVDAAARHIAARLANDWDDPAAVGAYVSEVRDVTGFEVRLLGDSHNLPGAVRRAQRHGALAGAGLDRLFVPVERDGVLLGALEFSRPGVRPARWGWWRPALALFAVLGVLLVMARRVAHLLAQPLEQLARAADRFGGGDLAFRADVGRVWRRSTSAR